MASIDFKDPQGPTNPNQASLLGRNLQDAIGGIAKEGQDRIDSLSDFKDNPVGAAKTAADIASTGVTLAGAFSKVNPAVLGLKTFYDLATLPGRYSDQLKEDNEKYGKDKTAAGTFFRSLPIVGGIFSLLSGKATRDPRTLDMRNYLAQRGVDINDFTGGEQIGDKISSPSFNPASTPVTQSNLAPTEDGSSVTDQESFDTFAEQEGFGVFNRGGIASL
tara:strand:- start:4361 stop:5017 length:657 start_codon:yes stop_codon:yes gene_type:complete